MVWPVAFAAFSKLAARSRGERSLMEGTTMSSAGAALAMSAP
jgi:hypothetical protein